MLVGNDIAVPLNVSPENRQRYIENLNLITRGTGKLLLFAGDQKIEHLNKDFAGEDIHSQDRFPRHLFDIASQSDIGVFATQFGLISRYAGDYKDIPFLVKMNSKTDLVPKEQDDPWNAPLVSIEDILRLRDEQSLKIVGIGLTLYIGSEYEHTMLEWAGRVITKAQKHGLITIVWVYPRGHAVPNERDPKIIAGAAGVATALGADFVKVNVPDSPHPYEDLKEAIDAAGNTGLIAAGGGNKPEREFLEEVYRINRAGAAGNAVGRNIHQRSLEEAKRLCAAMAKIIYENAALEEADKLLEGEHNEPAPEEENHNR